MNVAKCAAANHCVGGAQKEVHPFLQCMQKTCITVQLECLYDKDCSKAVRNCMKHDKFDYDHKCLSEKAKESEKVNSWYRCAGESFCLWSSHQSFQINYHIIFISSILVKTWIFAADSIQEKSTAIQRFLFLIAILKRVSPMAKSFDHFLFWALCWIHISLI